MLGKIKEFIMKFKTKNTHIQMEKYECINNNIGCDYRFSYNDWHCNGCKYKEIFKTSKF